LRDKGINVLTLHRDGKVIANPQSVHILEADDRLLCFGRIASMQELVPEKTRRRRRPKPMKIKESQIIAPNDGNENELTDA